MVKKLYKHEYLAWLRVMGIIYGIVLGVAALHRAAQLFENDSTYFGIILGSATFMYIVSVLCCLAAPVVFGVVRFYKNLFTGEGYLTFTLPVTPGQHLWVKVSTAVSFSLMSTLVVAASVLIITAGDVFTELTKAADYLFAVIPDNVMPHLGWYITESAVMLLLSWFSAHLLYDCCICIGQLFKKNRVLAAVGVFVAYYVLAQVLGTAIGIASLVLETSGALIPFYTFMGQDPLRAIHLVFGFSLVLETVFVLIFYGICHHIIGKKLNLE